MRYLLSTARAAVVVLACGLTLMPLLARGEEESDDCEQRLLRVLRAPEQENMYTYLASQAPEFLILLLPDPVETGATNVFDRTVEAVNEGIGSSGFLRDRYWLPWTAPHVGGDERDAQCAFDWPGVMVFRPAPDAPFPHPLIVLVVGESSVYGVHRAALSRALSWYQYAQPRQAVDLSKPLRILGPYYSGSVESLLQVLAPSGRLIPGVRQLKLASGTVQSDPARDRLEHVLEKPLAHDPLTPWEWPLDWVRLTQSWQWPPPVTRVEFFTASLGERLDHLQKFLKRAGPRVYLARLIEAGTQFGQPIPCETDEYGQEVCPLFLKIPPHIAAKPVTARQTPPREGRDEAVSAVPADHSTAPWRLSPVFAQQELPRDTIPALSSYDRQLNDLVLAKNAITLRDSKIADIIVSVTAPEDSIFLVRRLGDMLPARRFALTSLDLIHLHPELTAKFEGSLVVTAYPELGDFRSQSRNGRPGDVRHTLSRDASVGTYHAARWLLRPEADEMGPHENLTVGVIARERFWPLWPSQYKGVEQPRMSFWYVASALLVVTAYCLLFLVLLQFRDTTRGRKLYDRGLQGMFKPFEVFQPCLDPTLKRWHALVLTVTASAALVLSVTFASVLTLLGMLEGGWFAWGLAVLWGCAAFVSILLPWFRLRSWVSAMMDLRKRKQLYVWPYGPMLYTLLGWWIAGFTAYGVLTLKSKEAMAAALLKRSLYLAGGASPLSVLLVVAACLALFAYCHTMRLRSLDVHEDLSTPRGLLWRAIPECRPEEQRLLERASTPGGALYWSAFVAAFAFCAYGLLSARPSADFFDLVWVANNTVEDLPLALAMMVGVSTVLIIIILWLCKFFHYVGGLFELLRAVAASPCMDTLDQVALPLRTSVTEHLSRASHERWELMALWRPLVDAGIPAPPSLEGEQEKEKPSSLVATDAFRELACRIQSMAMPLTAPEGERSAVLRRYRRKDRSAIATYVAFVLGRYIKQIRYFMLGLTLPLAALFACTLLYPFPARRALFTILLVLTVGGLLVALITLLRLERDPVLMRIVGTTSKLSAVTAGLGKVFVWGAIPIGVALSTYVPAFAQRILQIFQLLGLSP